MWNVVSTLLGASPILSLILLEIILLVHIDTYMKQHEHLCEEKSSSSLLI